MSTAEPRTEDADWLEWRRQGITASDIARAASGRYGGAYAVVAEKQGKIEPQPFNARMARGQRLEVPVTTAAETLLGLHIVGEQLQMQHREKPHWRATLDGLAASIAEPTLDDCTHVVEVKTRALEVKAAWDYWTPQMQWQMLVSGIPAAMLVEAVVVDEDRICALRLHEVQSDPLAQVVLIDIADDLWQHLQAGTLPDPDARALDAVKAATLTVDPDAEVVDLSHLADDLARYATLRAAVKASEDERDELEARIRDAVGSATKGAADGYEVTVARPRRVLTADGEARILADRPDLGRLTLDKARARREAKDAYDAATEPVGARVLTVKEK